MFNIIKEKKYYVLEQIGILHQSMFQGRHAAVTVLALCLVFYQALLARHWVLRLEMEKTRQACINHRTLAVRPVNMYETRRLTSWYIISYKSLRLSYSDL